MLPHAGEMDRQTTRQRDREIDRQISRHTQRRQAGRKKDRHTHIGDQSSSIACSTDVCHYCVSSIPKHAFCAHTRSDDGITAESRSKSGAHEYRTQYLMSSTCITCK
jgi:hypothetical protein